MISRDRVTIEDVINLGIEKGVYLDPDMFWSKEDTLFWYDKLMETEEVCLHKLGDNHKKCGKGISIM